MIYRGFEIKEIYGDFIITSKKEKGTLAYLSGWTFGPTCDAEMNNPTIEKVKSWIDEVYKEGGVYGDL